MPLTGKAKTDYQRAYMRQRRTGQPKPVRPPSQRALRELARTELERREAAANVKRCVFCRAPQSDDRVLVGDGFSHICESCIVKAAALVAEAKESRTR